MLPRLMPKEMPIQKGTPQAQGTEKKFYLVIYFKCCL